MLGYVARGLAYSSFIGVAILSFASPAPSLVSMGITGVSSLAPSLPYLWGGLVLIASFACLMGVVTRTWVGEYIGLLPLMLCVLALGLAQMVSGIYIGGFVKTSLVFILLYRWYMVNAERAKAVRRYRNRVQWRK